MPGTRSLYDHSNNYEVDSSVNIPSSAYTDFWIDSNNFSTGTVGVRYEQIPDGYAKTAPSYAEVEQKEVWKDDKFILENVSDSLKIGIDNNFGKGDLYKKTIEELAKKHDRDIYLFNFNGCTQEGMDIFSVFKSDRHLSINGLSVINLGFILDQTKIDMDYYNKISIDKQEVKIAYETIKDFENPKRKKWCDYFVSNEFKVLDDKGIILAFVEEQTIYILLDLLHEFRENYNFLLKYIIEKGIKLINKNKKKLKGDFILYNFHKICGVNIQDKINKKEKEIKEIYDSINKIEQDLIGRMKATKSLEYELDSFRKNDYKKDIIEQYKLLKNLIKNKFYKNFQIKKSGTHNNLIGYTELITIDFENKKYDLGNFIVKLDPINGSIYITREDEKNPIHPQVSNSNIPCLGNIKTDIVKLIGLEQYGSVFQILYNFLCSYNPDSKHHDIKLWDKEYKPKEGEILTSAVETRPGVGARLEDTISMQTDEAPVHGVGSHRHPEMDPIDSMQDRIERIIRMARSSPEISQILNGFSGQPMTAETLIRMERAISEYTTNQVRYVHEHDHLSEQNLRHAYEMLRQGLNTDPQSVIWRPSDRELMAGYTGENPEQNNRQPVNELRSDTPNTEQNSQNTDQGGISDSQA